MNTANLSNEVAPDASTPDGTGQQNVIALSEFVESFGTALLSAVDEQNPPLYDGQLSSERMAVLKSLKRQALPQQDHRVMAGASLLVDHGQRAYVLNGEMGTGKTFMGIALAAVLHHEGFCRTLVVCPPHLVYKWRREIKQTVPDASVWILNGPDTLRKLLQIRAMREKPKHPTFFIMGRVRMRMGFNWVPSFWIKSRRAYEGAEVGVIRVAACPRCGKEITSEDADGHPHPLSPLEAQEYLNKRQMKCACGEALWTLKRDAGKTRSRDEVMTEALTQIPTIGQKTADKLLKMFGADRIGSMLEDNVYEFINLMDEDGELVFTDRQSRRMERAMATTEFSFGTGGYQPTEFVKRYLPKGYFGVLIGDEGHEFKNDGSAQGQAFGVLASQAQKAILLTGTLMGGYADDLFYLLWRLNPAMMIEDGFVPQRGSLGSAGMSFMRAHGVIKDIYRETGGGEDGERAHRTARGKARVSHRVAKAPGFGPLGIMRFVLPITSFLKLRDIGGDVLPPYVERFQGMNMTEDQAAAYAQMASKLKEALSAALRVGDKTLMGVVLNALLAWPDCAFRPELVYHPRTRNLLASCPVIFDESSVSPKEQALIDVCKAARRRGRKVLVYSCYTGTRDTTSRLKQLLEVEGFKVAVLRASVEAARREDWLMEQVDRGVDIVITNPELVKTGLDMLEFPTIVFMQVSYNVYTLQQAARRSWRIGQRVDVEVIFLGYLGTAQMQCLELMAKKIAVSQSTSGDMPDSGLDVLNDSGDSIEVALAKQLLAA